MIRIAILVANKTEDMELVIPADIWRRAGLYVKLISIEKKKNVILANGVKVSCDDILANENLSKYNAIYLPGGGGHVQFTKVNLPKLFSFMAKNANNPKVTFMAACAAPCIYGKEGMLADVKATCYPGYEDSFKKTYKNESVVIDKNFVTARSAGSMYEFSLKVIEKFISQEKAKEISEQIIYNIK